MRITILTALLSLLAICACSKENGNGTSDGGGNAGALENKFINRCNFESVWFTFHPTQMNYEIVANPVKDQVNGTRKCAKVVSTGGDNEFIWCDPMPRKLDFTRNAPVFKIKVLAPRAGSKVTLKIEHPDDWSLNPLQVDGVQTKKSGEWEELVFDFTDLKPENNFYQKFVLTFDRGTAKSGDTWYIDEIMCPSDDLTDICLFQRYEGNPVFTPEGPASWRNQHMANAGILSPANSPDGNWSLISPIRIRRTTSTRR